ncbi:hypothetical protein QYE76_031602 [Lolium multiflorum]|uniref:Transposase (putative) gypsy type domain-containing protein n=1 Tax=Lolium multiflorum TaxID=4521 RepID=A0AAD8QTW2_LOLMU|nr:hypothetical protein QYE76_031602 [Lolium multiflorum]
MGKKKSATTSDAAKVSRDWSASAISSRDINKLRNLGFISASEEDIRLPGAVTRPKPPKGFTFMFVAFLFRGLSLPAHEFLRSLLFFYGIQLWQLTPNSILHLSIFITVCEAFLGIDLGSLEEDLLCKRQHSNGPPVVGGVGFVVRQDVDYLDYPMKESVQGWRNKWFYLRDPAVSGQRSNFPPFEDKLVAKPKKSWQNALSPEERVIADKLFDQVVALKNTGGLTMCGRGSLSVPTTSSATLMSRPTSCGFTGKDDESRVSSADLSAEDLRDEVRRLTCLSAKDNIVLVSAHPPYDSQHLPTEVPAVAQCYPPILESSVEPEDDNDNSEETEDAQHTLEDSDVREEEATEDDAFLRSRRRKQIHKEFITTAESSPSGQDNDAAEAAPAPPAKATSTSFFALEDDLDFSDDDDEVPLAKRAKSTLVRKASVQEPKPSPARSTPPSRTTVEKIPVSRVIPAGSAPASSAARDHPIYATVDAVVDFAEQFTRLEAENAQLRKTVKSSADQVLEANRLASDAKKENALLKEEVSRLKQQMKDEQDARRAAAVAIDKKEGVLRESIKDLLETANITVSRRHQLREDSTADALSLAAESNVQVLGLLQKTKGALSRLYSMIFPKMKQDKTLGEMADAFLVDPSEPVEVLKRRNRLFGVVLTFQLLMGHGMGSKLEKLSKALPVDDDNRLIDLEPFKRSAVTCANQLLKLVDEAQAKPIPESAPGSSAANP